MKSTQKHIFHKVLSLPPGGGGGGFFFSIFVLFSFFLLLSGCARMGQPDGGWYDETPPRVIGSTPMDKATGVSGHKFYINFSEYIVLDNPTENVIVSPPQLEAPDIKSQGKRILVNLKDSLKPNTTYTVDFSNAITDNNEGNPLGNYTYTFSTGDVVDTLEVSGHVVDAQTLDPVKGTLVGLYAELEDSVFTKQPFLRVSRTDDRGHFTIRGVAPGTYRVFSLKDTDGDFMYTQKAEQIAFNHDIITPSTTSALRQDTIWLDTLHIDRIEQVGYTRFLPDDIVLRAFTAELTDRYLVKSERQNADRFSLYFSYGDTLLPSVRGLNFNSQDAFIVEHSLRRDTITYWLRDTTLVNTDSLEVELTYRATDSLGVLQPQVDTLMLLPRYSYEKRQKEKERKEADWRKQQNKKRRRGEAYDSIMPPSPLTINVLSRSQMAPDENIRFSFNAPLAQQDLSKIHLYTKVDSLWYDARYVVEPDTLAPRTYILRAEWRPDGDYSLEIDSAAFVDIYGHVSDKMKQGVKVKSLDSFSTLLVSMPTMAGKTLICRLMDNQQKVKKQVVTTSGQAEFFYIEPSTYYLSVIVDENENGIWDTGDYELDRQPEAVYFYERPIECRAKWDVTLNWNPTALPLNRQKPAELIKTETNNKQTRTGRNAERARKLGVQYTPPRGY